MSPEKTTVGARDSADRAPHDPASRALWWAGVGTLLAALTLVLVGVGALVQLHGVFSAGIAAVLLVYALLLAGLGWLALGGREGVSGIVVAAAVLHVLAVGEMALSGTWWMWLVEVPLIATAVAGVLSRVRRAKELARHESAS